MKDRVRKFKTGKMHSDELINFKEEVDSMTDEELDEYLNNCEPEFDFTNSDIDAIQDRLNEEIKAEKRQTFSLRFFKACAAVLFPALILCGVLLFHYHNDLRKYESLVANKIVIETDRGESYMTVLPDGSKVSMGPKSSLVYSLDAFNSEIREISYSGEGRFSISKNPNAPFTLILPGLEIKVLGTVFSLYAREDKNNAEIHLEEGALQLASFKSDSKRLLRPGETAIIDNQTGTISVVDDTMQNRRTAGNSTIYFKSSSLSNVTKELELYYGKEFIIGKELAEIHFTGSLPTNNIDRALYILENTLNVSISINATDNIITIKPKGL